MVSALPPSSWIFTGALGPFARHFFKWVSRRSAIAASLSDDYNVLLTELTQRVAVVLQKGFAVFQEGFQMATRLSALARAAPSAAARHARGPSRGPRGRG